jgi:hypothetical protein
MRMALEVKAAVSGWYTPHRSTGGHCGIDMCSSRSWPQSVQHIESASQAMLTWQMSASPRCQSRGFEGNLNSVQPLNGRGAGHTARGTIAGRRT